MLRCSFLLLSLVICISLLLPETSAAPPHQLQSCLDMKVKCIKDEKCKKKFKELSRKCRFDDAHCFNEENRVRCKELMFDIKDLLAENSLCTCYPVQMPNDIRKCTEVFNKIHANPCTFVPPAWMSTRPANFNVTEYKKTLTTTTAATTTTTTTTTTTEVDINTSPDVVIVPQPEIETVNENTTEVKSDPPMEEKLDSGDNVTFFTAAGLVFLSGSVILILAIVIFVKLKPGSFSSKFGADRKSKGENVLLSYSPSSAVTRTSRIELNEEETADCNQELIPSLLTQVDEQVNI